MKKLSSYQKLKVENQRLRQDIYDLVMKKEEYQGLSVYERYRLKYTQNDLLMFGRRSPTRPMRGRGILSQITKIKQL